MVYVDDLKFYPKQTKKWCHMVADSLEELHEMAEKIGLKREWFQNISSHPHYDLTEGKRREAATFGAKEVSSKEIVAVIRKNREKGIEK